MNRSYLLCHVSFFFLLLITRPSVAHAVDGLRDNDPTNVRSIPRKGISVPDEQKQLLEKSLTALSEQITELRAKDTFQIRRFISDVVIFHRAVDNALRYNEFFQEEDLLKADQLLKEGKTRAQQLLAGRTPWTRKSGLVVRGYRSRIDHTVQPYGLVIPPNYQARKPQATRVDIWFHGRGETLSEVNFLHQRMHQKGAYTPGGTIVLHPYGRYCNAFKFAGEVDVLEALKDVQTHYRVDRRRTSVRGFSMGGAACWQFAVHYADRWFAANPGAGFSETPEFLKFFQKETLKPTWYEKKLWHWYDCPDWAINLYHCPTVAYSGERDIQKQAADIMETALANEGINLVHIIGPDTEHSIHEDSKVDIEKRIGNLARRGINRIPRQLHFKTWTLKYNRMHWLTVEGLGEHWSQARVDASLQPGAGKITLNTSNVTDLLLTFASGDAPFDLLRPVTVSIDNVTIKGPHPQSDRSLNLRLHRADGSWQLGPRPKHGIRKRHNLQGPIDDAFMDSFIFVRPSESSPSPEVETWVEAELEHAITHWRQQFRGDARVKMDYEITDQDVLNANLILWGDPQSNVLLNRMHSYLPIQWKNAELQVGSRRFKAEHHIPLMIFPNPLNPNRYIVLNSGFTYREFAYLNNARQVPKLPDWAIIDIRTPADSLWPGKVVDADFFDEFWKLRSPRSESK